MTRPSADCTRGDRHQRGVRGHRIRDVFQRYLPHPHSAAGLREEREENACESPAAVSTSLPPGRLAAMSPAKTDAWLPTATAEGSTPTSRAEEDRAAAKGAS
jgi:hypothetical protein